MKDTNKKARRSRIFGLPKLFLLPHLETRLLMERTQTNNPDHRFPMGNAQTTEMPADMQAAMQDSLLSEPFSSSPQSPRASSAFDSSNDYRSTTATTIGNDARLSRLSMPKGPPPTYALPALPAFAFKDHKGTLMILANQNAEGREDFISLMPPYEQRIIRNLLDRVHHGMEKVLPVAEIIRDSGLGASLRREEEDEGAWETMNDLHAASLPQYSSSPPSPPPQNGGGGNYDEGPGSQHADPPRKRTFQEVVDCLVGGELMLEQEQREQSQLAMVSPLHQQEQSLIDLDLEEEMANLSGNSDSVYSQPTNPSLHREDSNNTIRGLRTKEVRASFAESISAPGRLVRSKTMFFHVAHISGSQTEADLVYGAFAPPIPSPLASPVSLKFSMPDEPNFSPTRPNTPMTPTKPDWPGDANHYANKADITSPIKKSAILEAGSAAQKRRGLKVNIQDEIDEEWLKRDEEWLQNAKTRKSVYNLAKKGLVTAAVTEASAKGQNLISPERAERIAAVRRRLLDIEREQQEAERQQLEMEHVRQETERQREKIAKRKQQLAKEAEEQRRSLDEFEEDDRRSMLNCNMRMSGIEAEDDDDPGEDTILARFQTHLPGHSRFSPDSSDRNTIQPKKSGPSPLRKLFTGSVVNLSPFKSSFWSSSTTNLNEAAHNPQTAMDSTLEASLMDDTNKINEDKGGRWLHGLGLGGSSKTPPSATLPDISSTTKENPKSPLGRIGGTIGRAMGSLHFRRRRRSSASDLASPELPGPANTPSDPNNQTFGESTFRLPSPNRLSRLTIGLDRFGNFTNSRDSVNTTGTVKGKGKLYNGRPLSGESRLSNLFTPKLSPPPNRGSFATSTPTVGAGVMGPPPTVQMPGFGFPHDISSAERKRYEKNRSNDRAWDFSLEKPNDAHTEPLVSATSAAVPTLALSMETQSNFAGLASGGQRSAPLSSRRGKQRAVEYDEHGKENQRWELSLPTMSLPNSRSVQEEYRDWGHGESFPSPASFNSCVFSSPPPSVNRGYETLPNYRGLSALGLDTSVSGTVRGRSGERKEMSASGSVKDLTVMFDQPTASAIKYTSQEQLASGRYGLSHSHPHLGPASSPFFHPSSSSRSFSSQHGLTQNAKFSASIPASMLPRSVVRSSQGSIIRSPERMPYNGHSVMNMNQMQEGDQEWSSYARRALRLADTNGEMVSPEKKEEW